MIVIITPSLRHWTGSEIRILIDRIASLDKTMASEVWGWCRRCAMCEDAVQRIWRNAASSRTVLKNPILFKVLNIGQVFPCTVAYQSIFCIVFIRGWDSYNGHTTHEIVHPFLWDMVWTDRIVQIPTYPGGGKALEPRQDLILRKTVKEEKYPEEYFPFPCPFHSSIFVEHHA